MFLRLKEVEGLLPVSGRLLRKMAESGELPGARRFGSLWIVEKAALEAYLGQPLPEPQEKTKGEA